MKKVLRHHPCHCFLFSVPSVFAIHPLCEHFNACPYPEKPSLLRLVGSHKPDQTPPTVFLHQLCWCYRNHSWAGSPDEGSDCIQPRGGPVTVDSFKGRVSEYRLCALLRAHSLLSVLTLSRYLCPFYVILVLTPACHCSASIFAQQTDRNTPSHPLLVGLL